MRGKYEPLTRALTLAAGQGRGTVELRFDEVAELVGGLPESAGIRQWWANGSQVQALAWRAAGFHVDQVYLDRRLVRFVRGQRGGSHQDRGTVAPGKTEPASTVAGVPLTGGVVDVRVRLEWLGHGAVVLDTSGKLSFPTMPRSAGLYRLTLTGGAATVRPLVYIGETDNLYRRLAGNYRNPGPTQQTSLRISTSLTRHLAGDGTVAVAAATRASVWFDSAEQPLDLSSKAGRLLAESAAIILARTTANAEILNLG
jgi:hypothetical protein